MKQIIRISTLTLSISLALSACTKNSATDTKSNLVAATAISASAPVAANQSSCNTLGGPNFVPLVKQVASSVVNISAEIGVKQQGLARPDFDSNDPWAELFKRFGQQPQPQTPSKAYASGFIVSTDGYVLTNAHVVNQATKITVTLDNKQRYNAKLIGLDTQTDIALLKIDAKNLVAAKLGNPDKLEVGEWVIAIGAPFGLDSTVTAGIVSAKGRNLPSENYVPFIQTDVAINPGNSGGPLFNLNGEVVGINSQIYRRSGGFMGISFSIPIDVAVKVVEQLKQNGSVHHGRLGVEIQELTPELAQSFGIANYHGALVANVIAASGAAKAGIQTGDVIVAVDGKKIDKAADLPILIGAKKPADKVKLELFRNGKALSLDVVLGADPKAPTSQPLMQKAEKQERTTNIDKFGLKVLNVNDPQVSGQIQAKTGVVVIASDGIAAMAGLTRGDVILRVNNKEVDSVGKLNNLLANVKQVALLIQRDDQKMYLSINVN